jgi:transcription termination/antitermination protein NusG
MLMRLKDQIQGTEITDIQSWKREKARDATVIRVSELHMATWSVACDSAKVNWFCLQVRTKSETTVENYFREHDVNAIVPRRQGDKIHKRHRTLKAPMLPVMPGYMMVRCAPSIKAFRALRATDHVQKIIGGTE